ncbi:MFS transporter [Arthrobacter oryzae]|uniref:Putative MFS family arabinose efflux permease n=1 Tax=Arthrobacter oryzae TaxID=409290 RepID=A0A495E9W8_9MICC|nr:MFS transporter [Arthrobacter oryzae]RKR13675.1 putative MFS family arabinose efflux permease [Arthrobacter oryzae]
MVITTAAGPTTGRSSLLPLIVLSLCGFISVTTELLPSGLLTGMAADLGTGISAAGALTSAYAAAIVLTVLPLTSLTIGVPRRLLFAAILCIFAAANVLVALSPTLPVAVTGRVLAGVAHGLLWATIAPMVGRISSPARAPRAMAIVFAGTSLGLAAGAPLGTLLGQALGWRSAFLILAGVSLLLAVLAFLTIPMVSPDSRRPLSVARAIRLPGVGLIIGGWAVMLLAHFAVLTYIAPFLEHAGLGEMVGAALAVLGITGLLGVGLAGRVPRRALFVGLLAAPMFLVSGLLGLSVLPLNLATAVALLGIWGIGYSAAAVFDQQVVLVVGHEAPDTVTSISVVAIQLGIALGAALGGLTVDILGVTWVPLIGAVFAAGSVALRMSLRRFLPHHPLAAAS